MRIRTVKPEFFTHPVLARLSETAKNLAVGLLCYADDEGYFLADPVLVRSAIRPYDDNSRSTHGALTELSNAGFISVTEHPTHGKIGLVVNFQKHQVINRATSSKLAPYYGSHTTPGVISEPSLPEGKGKEQGKEGNRSARGTLEEVTEFCISEKLPASDGPATFHKWEGNGWTNDGKPIKDWKATIRAWKARGYMASQKLAAEAPRQKNHVHQTML